MTALELRQAKRLRRYAREAESRLFALIEQTGADANQIDWKGLASELEAIEVQLSFMKSTIANTIKEIGP